MPSRKREAEARLRINEDMATKHQTSSRNQRALPPTNDEKFGFFGLHRSIVLY
jgi:hypothetical protein